MNFSTYGPFELKSISATAIDEFYAEINGTEGLERGIGVYVVAAKSKDGELKPWYVGQTKNGFGTRLKQHLEAHKFSQLSQEHGALSIFLIALVKSSGKMKVVTASRSDLKAIDRLELALIGSCLSQNGDLSNKKEKVFHASVHVPGYWNSSAEYYDDSARQFAKLVGVSS